MFSELKTILIATMLSLCFFLALGVLWFKAKSDRLIQAQQTLVAENAQLAEQHRNQRLQLVRYQQQVEQLNSALQQQKQQADRRSEQLNEALQHEQNQTWRNQPVPDDIKRLFNAGGL
ncbi:hypothetical protein ACUHGC_07340 [Testudinibacter sp. P27/CKL/0425]